VHSLHPALKRRRAAKGRTRPPLAARSPLPDCPRSQKLASGVSTRNHTPHPGSKGRKSRNALGMRACVRHNRVGPLFHRWYESRTGRYSRPDPLVLSPEAYFYVGQRPTVMVDAFGLQRTLMCAGNTTNAYCCSEAQRIGLMPPDSSGTVICCHGRKVACVPQPDRATISAIGQKVVNLVVACQFRHEREAHIPSLPDCPPFLSPMPIVEAYYPTEREKWASECVGADLEISCLEQSKASCSGDASCIQLLETAQAVARGLKRDAETEFPRICSP
jgi:hypothetical protein